MGQLQILVTRPESLPASDFNTALRLGLGEAAHREGVESLVVHLIDEAADAVDPGGLANTASFHALIGVGVARGDDELPAKDAILEVARDVGTCHAYRVAYRVIKASADRHVGERTPGIVMVSTVKRAPVLDAEAFDAHWEGHHAPLAVKHHVGMSDYRQLSVRAVLSEGSPAWDGFALMGFPTVQDFQTGLFDSEEGMKIIMADTERFLALDQGETAMMSEYWLRA